MNELLKTSGLPCGEVCVAACMYLLHTGVKTGNDIF